jgi:hypothetical protein
MKRIAIMALLSTVIFYSLCGAKVIENRNLPDSYTIGGKSLLLNGAGIRKKLFIKIYIGALYLPSKVKSAEVALASGYPGVIKMHFLYSKLEPQKIVETFAEGLKSNSPELSADKTQKFLSLFTYPLSKDDVMDLVITDKNNVEVIYNGKKAGSAVSDGLGTAVMKIFLGNNPADKDMKAKMLGE